MNIPACIMPLLTVFRPAFSTPTYHRFLVLVLATVLTTGRRTVTNLLRTVRFQAQGQVSSDHRVVSQRRWSTWALARALITCLLAPVVPSGPVLRAGDETVTEPPGPHVCGQGRPREGGRSPPSSLASRWGQTGGVGSGLVKLPLATRPWALPSLGALGPPPRGGGWAGRTSAAAGAPGPAAAGAPQARGSRATRPLRRRPRRGYQRHRAVLPAAPPAPHVGAHV
jgi:hypothetical protein